MGENIGDLGGLEMAYSAYRRYVASHGEQPVLDGLTGDQRFFLAWAQVWRGKSRENALREQLLTDPHSPTEYRVDGVVPAGEAAARGDRAGPAAIAGAGRHARLTDQPSAATVTSITVAGCAHAATFIAPQTVR